MSITDRIWGAFTSMIKLEDKVTRQADALKALQQKVEDLSDRMIRLETALELGMARGDKSTRRIDRKG